MSKIKYIVHLADVHLRTYRMHDEYAEAFLKIESMLKELFVKVPRESVRIVIAGDLVHQKITISNEQLILGCRFLKSLADIAPLIVIAGNHDLLENNKDRMDSISPMIELLNHPDIHYYKESKCYRDENVVWANYSIHEENRRPDIEGYKAENKDDYKVVGLFHGPIISAKTDLGYEFEHGTALDYFSGNDIVLLGDIHLRQSFEHKYFEIVNGEKIEKTVYLEYSSSCVQQNFGEKINGHGFLIWNLEKGTNKFYEVPNNYGFYQFKVNAIDDIENNNEKLINI